MGIVHFPADAVRKAVINQLEDGCRPKPDLRFVEASMYKPIDEICDVRSYVFEYGGKYYKIDEHRRRLSTGDFVYEADLWGPTVPCVEVRRVFSGPHRWVPVESITDGEAAKGEKDKCSTTR